MEALEYLTGALFPKHVNDVALFRLWVVLGVFVVAGAELLGEREWLSGIIGDFKGGYGNSVATANEKADREQEDAGKEFHYRSIVSKK